MEVMVRDMKVLIDDTDYPLFSQHRWGYTITKDGICYIKTHIKGKTHVLARMLMNPPPGIVVDHINRDTLDNRRANLRLVSQSANCFNRGMLKNNTSGHKGVSIRKEGKRRFHAYIKQDFRCINLGYYETMAEAVAARAAGEKVLWAMTLTPRVLLEAHGR